MQVNTALRRFFPLIFAGIWGEVGLADEESVFDRGIETREAMEDGTQLVVLECGHILTYQQAIPDSQTHSPCGACAYEYFNNLRSLDGKVRWMV